MRLALLAALFACGGAPDFSALPATRCGLHVEGIPIEQAQLIEDVTVQSFAAAAELRGVCRALDGWKITITGDPIVPDAYGARTLDDTDPSRPVSGVTLPELWEIRVSSMHFIFPHEAAHVAQGCTEASGLHAGWWNVCTGPLKSCICEGGVDQLGNPCRPGTVQPALIDARAQLDAVLGQAP